MPFDCICDPASKDGYEFSPLIGTMFGACAYTPGEKTAYALGFISLMTWVVALLPQIIVNYRRKNSDALNPTFVLIWLGGGFCTLLGGVLTAAPLPLTMLGAYLCAQNLILYGQYLHYGRKNRKAGSNESAVELEITTTIAADENNNTAGHRSVVAPALALFVVGAYASLEASSGSAGVGASRSLLEIESAIHPLCNAASDLSENARIFGSICAWIAGLLFFFSRVPQVIQNHRRKSVVGLSIPMFCMIVFANLTLGLQVFLADPSMGTDFYTDRLPFIIGTIGLLLFDPVILWQAYMYRTNSSSKPTANASFEVTTDTA